MAAPVQHRSAEAIETTEAATASPLDSHPSPIAGPRHSNQATASLVLAILALPLLVLGFIGLGVAVVAASNS